MQATQTKTTQTKTTQTTQPRQSSQARQTPTSARSARTTTTKTTITTPYSPVIEPTAVTAVYLVESQYVAPGQMYTVDLFGQVCNCPAGQRGVPCKHLRWAEAFHDARVLAQRDAARATMTADCAA